MVLGGLICGNLGDDFAFERWARLGLGVIALYRNGSERSGWFWIADALQSSSGANVLLDLDIVKVGSMLVRVCIKSTEYVVSYLVRVRAIRKVCPGGLVDISGKS